ncbi:MAG: macro domain-containing protein [Limisphaerales bacterium]
MHTVGPVWSGGARERGRAPPALLPEQYEAGPGRPAAPVSRFPAISTGVYRYPLEEAARVALKALVEYFKESNSDMEVFLVCFDSTSAEAFVPLGRKRHPVTNENGR